MKRHFLMVSLLFFTLNAGTAKARYVNQTQRLYNAIQKNDSFTALDAADRGAIVNATEPGTGLSLLMLAAQKGNANIFMKLVAKGANLNYRKSNGVSVLLYAVYGGNVEIVRYLLGRGAGDFWSREFIDYSKCGMEANFFQLAVCMDRLDLARLIHKKYPYAASVSEHYRNGRNLTVFDFIPAKSEDKWTDFFLNEVKYIPNDQVYRIAEKKKYIKSMVARGYLVPRHPDMVNIIAAHGDFELFKKALVAGLNVQNVSSKGASVLMDAVSGGSEKIVRLLLDSNVSLQHVSPSGETSLHRAASAIRPELVRLLLEKGHPLRPDIVHAVVRVKPKLPVPTQKKVIEILKLVVEKGANLHHRTWDRMTVLHVAIRGKNMEIIRHLLGTSLSREIGEDVELLFDALYGDRSTMDANVKVLEELESRGIGVRLRDDRQGHRTLFHAALDNRDVATVVHALKRKLEDPGRAGARETPLLLALLEYRMKSSCCDSTYCMAYNIGAKNEAECRKLAGGQLSDLRKIIEALIADGTSLKIPGRAGVPPLVAAFSMDLKSAGASIAEKMVARLDEEGVNQAAADGTTALMLAAKAGSVSMVRKLLARGAVIQMTDKSGKTAINIAAAAGKDAIVSLLKETHSRRMTAFGMVERGEAPEKVRKELARLGMDYNDQGMTPLQHAIVRKQGAIVKDLISLGMGVRIPDRTGSSVARYLVRHGPVELLASIVGQENDVLRDLDAKKSNLLEFTILHENEEAMKILYERVPSVFFQEDFLRNPIRFAVLQRKPRVLEFLHRIGVSTHVFDAGETDLMRKLVEDTDNPEITKKFKYFWELDQKLVQELETLGKAAPGDRDLSALTRLAAQKNLNQYFSEYRFSHHLVRLCEPRFLDLFKTGLDPRRTLSRSGASLMQVAMECPLDFVRKLDAVVGSHPDAYRNVYFGFSRDGFDKAVFEFVFSKNQSFQAAGKDGETAIQYLLSLCHASVLEKLTQPEWYQIRNQKGELPIVGAIAQCDKDFLAAALKRANTEFLLDKDENNFAHRCVQAGGGDCLQVLTAPMLFGFNRYKQNPIVLALEKLTSLQQETLLDLKYQDAKDRRGREELIYALVQQKPDLVASLRKVEVDLNQALDDDGTTALIWAAKMMSPKLVKVLIEEGADVNREDKTGGNTPLVIAVIRQDRETIGLLLGAGAKRQKPNKSGETADALAKTRGLDLDAIAGAGGTGPDEEPAAKKGQADMPAEAPSEGEEEEGGKWPAEAGDHEEEFLE